MRRLYTITALVCSLLVVGCSSLFTTATIAPDDLYRTDNREVVVSRIESQAEKDAIARASDVGYGSPQSYSSIVADSYESAYARRLYGFNSPTYKLPSSYYNLVGNSTMYYATAYDPAYYNIMVSGDQVWVEPKYITSMFGSWGATNVTFGLYSSPWNYGWSYGVSPFYYSWWGYPRYSWYDWNWNICYNPWYYDWCWGYPSYGHHHHYPGFMPPQHRPGNRPGYHSGSRPNHGFVVTGSGASAGPGVGNLNGGRGTASSRYTSPTSNKNYGSTTVGTGSNRRGTVSTGINTNSSYQSSGLTVGGGTVRPSTNSGSNRGTATGGSSSNFRQSGSSSRGTSSSSSYRGSSSSSSSSSYRGSTTSSSRSSYSSGSSRSGSGGSSRSGGTTSSRR